MSHYVWLNFWKAGLLQKSAGDLMLGVAGVGLAGGAVAFAAYMVANSDAGPRINGADKFAIFAQPASAPYNGGAQQFDRSSALDTMPVGTIRSRTISAPPLITEKVALGYQMRGYSQGEALVQGPEGFSTVRVGDEINGLGRVIAIEGRGRKLVVVTTGGIIAGDD